MSQDHTVRLRYADCIVSDFGLAALPRTDFPQGALPRVRRFTSYWDTNFLGAPRYFYFPPPPDS
jgi:hypothetical protein